MADTNAQERRQRRLAQQLRANLVRRKQQARERGGKHEIESQENAGQTENSSPE
ncbi:hypothetical protein [uncultured Bartonella sp.]|uniref:hypothetical protein n=1 Tax=uncultured Bartonella sp. TaxID=104108 RepID=UPI00260E10AA|nr:hypothetical protein [uncultured Bartonella sp.]